MTLDRQHGRLRLFCDDCGEEFEAPADVDACPAFFDAFVESAKANGWRFIFKSRADFQHECPECAK